MKRIIITAMAKSDSLFPALSRRDFNKLTLVAGATVATGSLLGGCGSSKVTSSKNTFSAVDLHFDLSHLSVESPHTLRVAGKRHSLIPHTAESLEAAKVSYPYLADKQNISHYATNVLMPDHKTILYSVTSVDPVRGDCLVATGVHIPERVRAKVRKNVIKYSTVEPSPSDKNSCKSASLSVLCKEYDQYPDNFITTYDSAQALVHHHTEIASLDPDIAAQVEVHIRASSAVGALASKICKLGPAYMHDPAKPDGWCVLVPLTNSDGSAKLDSSGLQIYDYQFNPQMNDEIRAAINDVLKRIKSDPLLEGKMYTSHPQGSTEDNTVSAKVAKRVRLWKGSGVQLAATETGYKHNVWFNAPIFSGTGGARSFKLVIDNWNFICYGLYVEYLDASGRPLPTTNDTFWAEAGKLLESDTIKLNGMVLSPPTFFGVPLPSPQEIDITLPPGAASVRVLLCGPGAYGNVDFTASLFLGSILTLVMNYVLPTISLISGTGQETTLTLTDMLKKPGALLKVVLLLKSAVMEIITRDTAGALALGCSFESLVASIGEPLIQIMGKGTVAPIAEWLAENRTETELQESVPWFGWALRIAAVVGTVGDIITTVAETLSNPMVIDNRITFTNSVDITVNKDPANYQFPEEATYYEISYTVAGAMYPSTPQGFTLDQTTRGSNTFMVTIDEVPTTGLSTDTIEISFYPDSKKGWLAAHGSTTFANVSSLTNLSATITINENPIPLSATTVYIQHRKLAFSGGKYIWQEGAPLVNPVIEPSSCGGSGLCTLGNITVWGGGGMIGYTWLNGNSYKIKNINARESDPVPGMKLLDAGSSSSATPLAYDMAALDTNLTGNHFYLDTVNSSASNPEYHLRKLNLDSGSPDFKTSGSWGRFRIQLDRLAMTKTGYVVGISTINSKMAVLQLPDMAFADDNHNYDAVLKLGEGTSNELVQYPQAVTISSSGAVLILQGQNSSMSIKAFNVSGDPWPYFNNAASSSFPLVSVDANAQWLDIAIDITDLIYILSYTGSGLNQNDYHLDVYDKNGTRITRNTGIAVYRMVVDKFRRLYSLNQETIKGSMIVEPSTSVWIPSVPGQ